MLSFLYTNQLYILIEKVLYQYQAWTRAIPGANEAASARIFSIKSQSKNQSVDTGQTANRQKQPVH